MKITWSRFRVALLTMALLVVACGSGDDGDGVATAPAVGDGAAETVDESGDDSSEAAEVEEVDDAPEDEPVVDDAASGSGAGVILADLCSGGQLLNGAVSLDDLVGYGIFTSTDVLIEGNAAYSASTYETFGFICNLSETVGDGENFMTIGVKPGSDIFDLAVDQGDAPVEQMGNWEVIVGSNWLSPLTMRHTDDAGVQDSLFVVWTPADGSIPDAETLDRLMRPLGEAIAARSMVDIPRS